MRSKLSIIIIVGALILPVSTYAAGTDVTLTTDAIIQVGAHTLNVSGSSATLQSMTVNDNGTLGVTLASGSSINISSPDLYQLSVDTTSGVTVTCNSSASSLAITYSGVSTVTITPSATKCVDAPIIPVATSHSGSSASASTLRALGLSQLITPNTPGYDGQVTPTVPGCPKGMVCSPINSQTTPPSLQGAPASQSNAPGTAIFTRNLTYKSTGSDVTTLQSILNREGFLKVSPTGYYGPLTVSAVRAYQKAHNIPTTGTVGPMTKAALEKLFNI